MSAILQSSDYQLLLEHGSDIPWMLDCASGKLLYVSPAAGRMLGWPPEEVQDKAQAIAGPLLDDLPARLARFAGGDDSRRTVLRETELGGIPVEIESTLVQAEGGLRLVGVVRDISQRREVELQQKKFASMLSHEFRTPLSTIDGAIQRLEMTHAHADDATKKRYRKIQTAVDRLLAMLDEYLSPERLASIGRKRQENEISPQALLETAAEQARARRAAIAVRAEGLPQWLRADPQGMRLCLDILLDNAIKYSPPDSPIELLAGKATEGGVEFLVIDHGPAIPADELPRLFDKGYRGSASTGVPGSGLGLYMAKAVVDVHGGTVMAMNLPESGKKFRIWLPIAA